MEEQEDEEGRIIRQYEKHEKGNVVIYQYKCDASLEERLIKTLDEWEGIDIRIENETVKKVY